MAETYRGTYNPDKKRGELLKDNMATGEYFSDLKSAERKAKEMNAKEKGSTDGGRTRFIDRKTSPGMGKDILMGVSRFADRLGLRQDDTYEGKSDEELATKKAKGGSVKGYKSGGSVSSASKRADGCAIKGKTRGRFV
jgi:hypothetical protein